MKTGIELLAEERERQIFRECWSAVHDDGHDAAELARAAQAYVAHYVGKRWLVGKAEDGPHAYAKDEPNEAWPWQDEDWKPTTDPLRTLVKAGALIAAEIDRIQRYRCNTP